MGAVPPKKSGKVGKGCLIVVGVLVVLIIIGAIAGGGDSKPGGNQTEAVAPARKVTAVELARAFDANEAAAQKEYGDQPLEVTGVIDSINLGLGDEAFVVMKGENMFMGPQVHFADKANDAAAQLSKGQQLTVVCQNVSEVVGTPMLKDCSF